MDIMKEKELSVGYDVTDLDLEPIDKELVDVVVQDDSPLPPASPPELLVVQVPGLAPEDEMVAASAGSEVTSKRQRLLSALRAVRQSNASILVVGSYAMLVDLFIYAVVIPFLPLYTQAHFAVDTTVLGALFATFNIGAVLANPLFGVLSDMPRVGRRAPMLVALLTLIIATIFYGLATKLWMLFVARFFQGVAAAGTQVITFALIGDVYPIDQVGSKNAIVMSFQAIGAVLGPSVGGVMYDHLSYVSIFILCAALVAVDLVGRLVLIDEKMVQSRIRETQRLNQAVIAHQRLMMQHLPSCASGQLSDVNPGALRAATSERPYGILRMVVDKEILITGGAIFVIAMVFSAMEPVLAIYFQLEFGFSSQMTGVAYLALAVPYIIASGLTGALVDKLVYRNKLIMSVGMMLFAVGLPLVGYSTTVWALSLSLVLSGVAMGVAQTPLFAEVSEYLQSIGQCTAQAQGMAVINTFFTAGAAVGGFCGGLLYQHIGWFYSMLLLGMLCAGYAGLTLIFTRMVTDTVQVYRDAKRTYDQQRLPQLAAGSDADNTSPPPVCQQLV